MQNYEYLGKPLQIGRLTIKNRFCMAPIGGGQHHLPGGGLKDETIQYFVERAGAYGTKIFAQITMGLGRNYPNLPAPSSVHVFRHHGEVSPELTRDQIKSKIESVVKASKIAQDSGFSGVEVHSIHWGYLLDQFALSMMNHRTDEYGGSLENRLRAAKEILEGIKLECGSDFPVSMRLGLKTFVKGFEQASLTGEEEIGRTLEEGIEIARLLESYGYDCLNVDTGIYDSFYYACPPMYMPKGYLVELAAKAKEAVNIPILAGGRMNEADIAEKAIWDGKIDAVVLGRAALADPEYPNKVLTEHTEKIRPCIACNQGCITRLQQGKQPTCAVNPAAMREVRYALRPCVQPKKVVVVGGGVAGMEAARTAAMRGHKVSLYEKNESLGGNLIPGGSHSFKKEVRELNAWYQNELKALPVEVHTGENVTAGQLRNMDADVIILAAGSVPVMPKVPGIDDKKVIGGGLVGCEMALEYAQDGKEVTVVEALPKILSAGIPSPIPNGQMIPDLFEHHHVAVLENHRLSAVEDGRVILESGGQKKAFDADSVVIAIGFRPVPSMAQELQGCGAAVYEIGDGQKVSTILHAVWDGYEIGNNI